MAVTQPPVNNPVKETTTHPVKRRAENSCPATTTETPVNTAPVNYKGGYFKTMYSDAGKNTTGNAGIFRSTRGWKEVNVYE